MNSTLDKSQKAAMPAYSYSRKVLCDGIRDGLPIALGYFAVSFSLGIAARNAGLTPIQGFLQVFLTMPLLENMLPSALLQPTQPIWRLLLLP